MRWLRKSPVQTFLLLPLIVIAWLDDRLLRLRAARYLREERELGWRETHTGRT